MASNLTDITRDLMREAYLFASEYSDDPHTQNGSLLLSKSGAIVAQGANRFPQGVRVTPDRLERPLKYTFMEHAERDVIYVAAGLGVPTEGTTMYCPWAACADCARAIIDAGIERLVVHQAMMDKTPDRWKEQIAYAMTMFDEAGVLVEAYDGPVGGVAVLFDGTAWQP